MTDEIELTNPPSVTLTIGLPDEPPTEFDVTEQPIYVDLVQPEVVYIDVDTDERVEEIEITTGIAIGVIGVNSFLELLDVPHSYVGQHGKFVAVNAGETGLVFVPPPAGGGGTIEATTELLAGDDAGNAVGAGFNASDVVQKQPTFPTPANALEIVACLQAAGLCAGGVEELDVGGPPAPAALSGTIPVTTNLLAGDGSGNAADSGIAAADVCLKQPTFPTPTNAFEIIQCLQAAGLCA